MTQVMRKWILTFKAVTSRSAASVRRKPERVYDYRLEDWWLYFPYLHGLSYEDLVFCLSINCNKGVNTYFRYNKVLDKKQITLFCKYYSNGLGRGAAYKPEYWTALIGCTLSEGEGRVIKYKSDKVTSEGGFISRHGEVLGKIKYAEFQRTSALGTETKRKYNFDFRESTPWCIEYWITRGHTIDSAVAAVSKFQIENAGVNRGIYERKGHTPEEVDSIMEDINNRKNIYDPQLMKSRHNLNDQGIEDLKAEYINRMVNGLVVSGCCAPVHKQGDFKKYQSRVRVISSREDICNLPNIQFRGNREGDFHMDHKYSILKCFLDKVPDYIAGSLYNLQCITKEDNLTKAHNCSISLWELYYNYYEENTNELPNVNVRK